MSATKTRAAKPAQNPAAEKIMATFRLLEPEEHALSWRQMAALAFAVTTPDSSVRELAEALGVSKPAVTRALDALEERHMALRAKHPTDRRLIKVQATTAGMAFLGKVAGA